MASITNYPPALTSAQKEHLAFTVKNWSIQHGLAVRPNPTFVAAEHDPNSSLATNAPVTLFPSPFPRVAFEHAQQLQEPYNELYARISNDEEWLEDVLKDLIDVDGFVENLWKCHLKVKEEGYVQNLSLGLFRSDYMLDTSAPETDTTDPSIKQVEFNTISSSFGGLSALVSSLHTHLLSGKPSNPKAYPEHSLFRSSEDSTIANVPPANASVSTLARAIASAHTAYGLSKSSPSLPLCVLFLVQPTERNIFDQLAISEYLTNELSIPVFRLPTSTILGTTSIPSSNKSRPLLYTPPSSPATQYEATVVYFRALYAPSEYDSPDSWTARIHLERSAAIKCPTVLTQLAGTKKVQQALTSSPPLADHLKNFLPGASPTLLSSIRATFAPQYPLTPMSNKVGASNPGLDLALNATTAENHVLKPQREGGGNNVYKLDIPPFLRSLKDKAEYKAWILMELIKPPDAKNVVLRQDGQVVTGDVVSELGIFGGILWEKTPSSKEPRILNNNSGGYLLRTKGKESNEGGVAAGFSSLDSILLY
ncbi:putative glutathione synthetase [Phaeomoniella chlamydospora]|uniref:Glutathione synthetase n=1 Tax=Phaeomoniella chlamydospora TaxID=158046 RepID=A0A0G2GWM6_PHACM|nr:putative glutathione synthetase [Phaeomoniella chlamydospora]